MNMIFDLLFDIFFYGGFYDSLKPRRKFNSGIMRYVESAFYMIVFTLIIVALAVLVFLIGSFMIDIVKDVFK